MRSIQRQEQDMYYCTVSESLDGYDTIQTYGKPTKFIGTIGVTHGIPLMYSSGMILDYERYVILYDDTPISEGMCVFVDVIPKVDDEGNLLMSEDGLTPVTPPDYMVERQITAQRIRTKQFCLKKRDNTA